MRAQPVAFPDPRQACFASTQFLPVRHTTKKDHLRGASRCAALRPTRGAEPGDLDGLTRGVGRAEEPRSPLNDVEGTRTRITKGDVLITITGANVSKAALVDRVVPEAYVSQHVALVRLKQPELATWVQRWLISPSAGRGQLLGSSYGDKPGLNLTQVKSVVVDLPPPAERDRILTMMADMLAQCDRLASRLEEAEDRAAKLVEAAAQELVAGDSTE